MLVHERWPVVQPPFKHFPAVGVRVERLVALVERHAEPRYYFLADFVPAKCMFICLDRRQRRLEEVSASTDHLAPFSHFTNFKINKFNEHNLTWKKRFLLLLLLKNRQTDPTTSHRGRNARSTRVRLFPRMRAGEICLRERDAGQVTVRTGRKLMSKPPSQFLSAGVIMPTQSPLQLPIPQKKKKFSNSFEYERTLGGNRTFI